MAWDDWKTLLKDAKNTALSDMLPGGVAGICLREQKVFFCSSNLLSFLGYSQQEWEALTDSQRYIRMFGQDTADYIAVQTTAQLKQTGRASLQCTIFMADDSPLAVRMLAGTGQDETDGPFALCIFLDDRDTQQALAEMARAQKEMDTLTKTIPGGVARLYCDADFHIVFASDGYYEMIGYTREEFHEEPSCDRGRFLILEEDMPAVQSTVERLIKFKKPEQVEYRIRKRDGSIAWNTAYCAGAEEENGHIFIDAVFVDNTAAKNTENRLVSLTNSIPGGVAHIRVGNTLVADYASDGFYRLAGYEREEYERSESASDYLMLVHPEDRATVLIEARRFMKAPDQYATLSYRIVQKNGTIRWIRISAAKIESDAGFTDSMECVFSDITDSRQIEQQLELNEERYRIVTEQTQDIIFDWDLKTDHVYHSPVFQRKFGYEIPSETALDFIQNTDCIHEADHPHLQNWIDRVRLGDPTVETEYRVKKLNGQYVWCRIRAKIIYDDQHRPTRAVGVITDIDDYKREAAFLREKAQIDLLTGLLNKMTTQEQIAQLLLHEEEDIRHALYVIDIDNFKQINDSLGHSLGDAILTEISGRIRQQFRKGDIIGRIGGDEFVVFLNNIPSDDTVRRNAEKLAAIFHHTFFSQNQSCKISGSIGVAVFPRDGKTFPELYQNADQALYLSKRKGKDCFSFFGETDGPATAMPAGSVKSHKIDSEAYSGRDFVQLVFEMLYDARDLDKSVQTVLNLIAHQYQIDQIYLYTCSGRYQFDKQYEYRGLSGAVSLPASLSLSSSELEAYRRLCDENGILFREDSKAPQDALLKKLNPSPCCVLQALALEGDACMGFAGFRSYLVDEHWLNGQKETCTLLLKILTTFLAKKSRMLSDS